MKVPLSELVSDRLINGYRRSSREDKQKVIKFFIPYYTNNELQNKFSVSSATLTKIRKHGIVKKKTGYNQGF
jgi:hypothetical protein